MGACDVNVRLHPDDAEMVGRIAVPPHTTQVELTNKLVTSIAAADPEVCMLGT